MDIGKTIRCYTVEPLRDPVPAPRQYSVRVPSERELVSHHDRNATDRDVLTQSILRRIGG